MQLSIRYGQETDNNSQGFTVANIDIFNQISCIMLANLRLTDWLIDFNCMSNPPGLSYAKYLGNSVHCSFIFTFLCCYFLRGYVLACFYLFIFFRGWGRGLGSLFNGISTFVGYLMPLLLFLENSFGISKFDMPLNKETKP